LEKNFSFQLGYGSGGLKTWLTGPKLDFFVKNLSIKNEKFIQEITHGFNNL